MELDYNLFALFETVGFIQALTLGTLLIFLNKNKYKSTFFLGVFLILYALETIPVTLDSLKAYGPYPELFLLPFDFFWLHFPIFFLYVQRISIYSNQKITYWVIYPGVAMFFVQLFVFFLSYETKVAITEHFGFALYFWSKMAYGIFIGILTLKYLSHHKVEVKNYFSKIESAGLRWAKVFLICNICGYVLYAISSVLIPDSALSRIFFAAFHLTLIYWVSYHGVEQRNILSLLSQGRYGIPPNEFSVETNLPALSTDGLETLMQRIDDHMISTEGFIYEELTIVDLAKELDIHPKRISTTINTICHQNFNNYVNQFRIRKAEKLLENTEYQNFSIEGIGYEVGFHSKSAFYSAFKKFTGTTPSKYKEHVMA